jgi:Ca2+-binding RTX toxin-like protein
MARSLPALIVAALLIAAPAAHAHSLVRVGGGLAQYISVDEVSLNQLIVRRAGERIEFYDPPAYQGLDIGPCEPGEISGDGVPVQAFCAAAGVNRLRLELGNREDTVTVTAGLPAEVLGGDGQDALTTGDEADTIDGGLGNDRIVAGGGADVITGGEGVDEIDAGAGDDDVRVRDGLADTVRCGDGTDRVDADGFDVVAGDCEAVARTATAAPPDASLTATDRTAPTVDASAITRQKLSSRGVIKVVGTSSERGTLGASGYITIGGLNLPLGNVSRPIAVAGGGAELSLKLTKSQLRQARRALQRKRRVSVFLSVVATDAAGNSAQKRAPRIRLR